MAKVVDLHGRRSVAFRLGCVVLCGVGACCTVGGCRRRCCGSGLWCLFGDVAGRHRRCRQIVGAIVHGKDWHGGCRRRNHPGDRNPRRRARFVGFVLLLPCALLAHCLLAHARSIVAGRCSCDFVAVCDDWRRLRRSCRRRVLLLLLACHRSLCDSAHVSAQLSTTNAVTTQSAIAVALWPIALVGAAASALVALCFTRRGA